MSVDGLWRQDRIRFKEQLRQRDEKIVNLEADIDKTKSTSAAPGTVRLEDHFSSEELEAMDESTRASALASLMAAHRVSRSELDKAQATARKSAEDQSKERAEEARRTFLNELTALFPNWVAVNKEPGWIDYLGELNDEGEERQDALNRAQQNGNSLYVSNLFKAYERTKAAKVDPPKPPETPKPPVMPENKAAGGAPADSNPPPAEKPPSQSEIKDFYKRSALGKVSKEERAEFEARISALMNSRG